MKNWKRGWWRWRMEGKGMSDRESLETLVAKYRSTRSQGWTEAAAAHAEALCAAVERLVAEPTHANASAWSLKYSLAADSLATRDRELADAIDMHSASVAFMR